MMRFLRHGRQAILLPLMLAGALAAPAIAASRAPSTLKGFVVTSWSDKDGLVGSWIRAIVQDARGYLWLGTESGLLRFDGVRFVRFESHDTTELPRRSVASLGVARDGSLWVGFSAGGGISRILDGRVTNYNARNGFSATFVSAIIEDRSAGIWAATRDGLYRFASGRWERLGKPHGVPEGRVYSVYQDRSKTIWISTSAGILKRSEDDDMFRRIEDPLLPASSAIEFSESPAGAMWMTDELRGFRSLDSRKGASRPERGRQGTGTTLLHDLRGNLWVATSGRGLWFLETGHPRDAALEVIRDGDGRSTNSFQSLYEDREGNIWAGTQIGVLYKLSPRRLAAVTDLGNVRALDAAPDGDVWVGTADGLIRFSGGRRRQYGVRDGLPSAGVRALHVDDAGVLSVATSAGVARFDRERFRPLPSRGRPWPARIHTITTDATGTLWMCDQDEGLLRWNSGRLEPFDPSPEIRRTSIDSVAADTQGRVWLAVAGGGIGMLERDGRFHLIRANDQFNLSDLAIYEDEAHTVWFGGGDRVSRFKDGKLAALTRPNGFPGDSIRAIADDEDGFLWIGTSSGVVRLAKSEFDKAVLDPTHRLEFRLYDSSDGLSGMPARTGYRNAARSRDGHLWFVTGDGLARVDPHHTWSRPVIPVGIERLSANGRSIDIRTPITLPARTGSLQIEYTALTFLSPTKVHFRYRLEGFDETWTDAGTRRQAFYTNLPPRDYRFHVAARTNEGAWNDEAATVDFSIQPTFYQTTWFYSLCSVMALMAVVAGWRLRLRQVHRRFALVLGERVRLSREIHDTLLQSLVGLALELDVASTRLEPSSSAAKQQMGRLRRQVEQHIREARDSIWNLRSPRLERCELEKALRDACAQAGSGRPLQSEFVVKGTARRCSPEVEEQVFRIGQEAITNVVRHSHARRVRAELTYQSDALRLHVSDDGDGFDAGDPAARDGKHCGLLIMQERAEQIGGTLTLTTRPGSGTDLELVIPLASERVH